MFTEKETITTSKSVEKTKLTGCGCLFLIILALIILGAIAGK